ncbi:MAG: AMP nucleosidase [Alphaproteobacteria bacterium]
MERTNIREAKSFNSANDAVNYLEILYRKSCKVVEGTFKNILNNNKLTASYKAYYPFLGIEIKPDDLCTDPTLSYGVITKPGFYGTTLTRPDIFKDYYKKQISILIKHHNVPVIVGLSDVSIPLPFVVDHSEIMLDAKQQATLKSSFILPNLSRIDDSIPNGTFREGALRSLSLFSAERVDYSINRLCHYTGTSATHFQSFVLLTNYQRYIEAFIKYSIEQLKNKNDFFELVGPGDMVIASSKDTNKSEELSFCNLPQMPTYHLKRKDKKGITFVNIGVGPSNAKNITDHLAVLRPDCWIMLGHCAGLRSTQRLGDYVLAHAYVRDDHVLDQDLPCWVPLPSLAEIQLALQKAAQNIVIETGEEIKARMRTGTVITTDDRNWELRFDVLNQMFNQTRAIAIDMESATIAANGFRFRVPYGTLLCVSDKPIHGEIKLKGTASTFYKKSVSQHLKVGLEAIRILREDGDDKLQSRKLRGVDDPPFR